MARINVEIDSFRCAHILEKLLLLLMVLLMIAFLGELVGERGQLARAFLVVGVLATAVKGRIFHGDESWIHIDEFTLYVGLWYFRLHYIWLLGNSILSFF